MKNSFPPFPKLSGRLYFFPALLPAIEILPWLLAAMGTVAGMVGFRGRTGRIVKYALFAICMASITGAAYYAWQFMPRPIRTAAELDHSTLVARKDLPVPVKGLAQAMQPDVIPAAANPVVRPSWAIKVKSQILSSPAIAKDAIIFGDYDGQVEARSLKNGEVIWKLPKTDIPVFAIAAADDGIVYAGQGLHENDDVALTAIDAASGKPLWARKFLGHIEEPPFIDLQDGRIFVGTGPAGLWALARGDGGVIWHAAIGHADTRPLLHDRVVYAPAQPDEKVKQSKFFALDAADGKTLWSVDLPGQPWGSPYYDAVHDAIIVTSGQGQIGIERNDDAGWAHAISVKTHKIIWSVSLPSTPIGEIYVHAGKDMFVVTSTNGMIAAHALSDGHQLWQLKCGKTFQSAAAPVDIQGRRFLAASTYEGILSLIVPDDGTLYGRWNLGEKTTTEPISAYGYLYAFTAFKLAAFEGHAQ